MRPLCWLLILKNGTFHIGFFWLFFFWAHFSLFPTYFQWMKRLVSASFFFFHKGWKLNILFWLQRNLSFWNPLKPKMSQESHPGACKNTILHFWCPLDMFACPWKGSPFSFFTPSVLPSFLPEKWKEANVCKAEHFTNIILFNPPSSPFWSSGKLTHLTEALDTALTFLHLYYLAPFLLPATPSFIAWCHTIYFLLCRRRCRQEPWMWVQARKSLTFSPSLSAEETSHL